MSRETYPLSDESRQVLTDNVKSVAFEMDVHESYLYQVLSSVECDSFAKFRRLYSACVRAGVDVSPWDASFAEIRAKYRVEKKLKDVLPDKMHQEADTNGLLHNALKDGRIDPHEKTPILRAVQVERNTLDYIEDQVVEPDVRGLARKAVAKRRNGK